MNGVAKTPVIAGLRPGTMCSQGWSTCSCSVHVRKRPGRGAENGVDEDILGADFPVGARSIVDNEQRSQPRTQFVAGDARDTIQPSASRPCVFHARR